MGPRRQAPTRRAWLSGTAVLAALALIGGVLLWRVEGSDHTSASKRTPKPAAANASLALADALQPAPLSEVSDGTDVPKPGSFEQAAHAVAPDEAASKHRPAHPLSAAHSRIYRENALNGAMMGAMNVRDHQGLRALLEEYRLDYPEDAHRLREGYTLVADCLEKLTPERQATAREYWKTKRGSPVRRFIRRYCLDQDTKS